MNYPKTFLLLVLCGFIGGVTGYVASRYGAAPEHTRGSTISIAPPMTTVPYLRLDNNQWLSWGAYTGGTVNGFRITTTDVLEVGAVMQANYGLLPASRGSDPCGSGFPEGAIFWNMSSYYPCYCDHNGDDLKVSDDSACF